MFILRVKYLNVATRVFLIRSRHGGPDKIISSSLPFIHNIRKEVDKKHSRQNSGVFILKNNRGQIFEDEGGGVGNFDIKRQGSFLF